MRNKDMKTVNVLMPSRFRRALSLASRISFDEGTSDRVSQSALVRRLVHTYCTEHHDPRVRDAIVAPNAP